MTKQLKSLFNCLCMELKINNFNDNPIYTCKSLKLDHNSIYGGYRLDYVNPDTSESFFIFSSRFTPKEMTALIQGLLYGLNLKKAN